MQLETMYSRSTTGSRPSSSTARRCSTAPTNSGRATSTRWSTISRGTTDVRVVVVRGAGRAFCSGIDITALSQGEIGMSFFRNWEAALRKMETMDAVVIAAIQSHCIGGGLQIALACDLRVARDDARFGITAVSEGIIPGIGMWRVARHAGSAAPSGWRWPPTSSTRRPRSMGARRLGRGRRRLRSHGRRADGPAAGHGADIHAAHQEADQHGVRDVRSPTSSRPISNISASRSTSPEHLQVMAEHRAERASRRR